MVRLSTALPLIYLNVYTLRRCVFVRKVAINLSPHSLHQRECSIHNCLTLYLCVLMAERNRQGFYWACMPFCKESCIFALPYLICWGLIVALYYSLPQSAVCIFREAVFLGPATTAVQRASSGRSGRSCQQADGQVCRKVSVETALPVGEGANNGGKILGPNSHTFWGREEVEGIGHLSVNNKSWQ